MRTIITTVLAIACATGGAAAAETTNVEDKQSAGVSEGGRKPFGEWVAIMEIEHEAFYKAHPDLREIEKGAAIVLNSETNRYYKENKLTDSGKKYVKAYLDFINSPHGKAMLEQWKDSGKLVPTNSGYRYVIQAISAEEIPKKKGHPISKLFVKAVMQEKLTRAEVESMRFYLAAAAKTNRGTEFRFKFNKAKYAWGGIDWRKVLSMSVPLKPGTKVPDFNVRSYDKFKGKHPYDSEWHSFSGEAFLTPEFLAKYAQYYKGLAPQSIDGTKKLVPNLISNSEGQKEISVTLSDLQKGERPFFIVKVGAEYTFFYLLDTMHMAYSALNAAFRDKIDIYLYSADGFYGGYTASMLPNALGVDDSVIDDVIVDTAADTSPFAIPFRIRNNIHMRYPYYSRIPILYDNDMGTLSYAVIGSGAGPFICIDRNGIQCAPEYTWYVKGLLGAGLRHTGKAGVAPLNNRDIRSFMLQYKRMIRFLKLMESLDWKYDETNKELKDFYKTYPKVFAHEYGRFAIRDGLVKEIDIEKGYMLIEGKSSMRNNTESEHRIQVTGKTRVGMKKDKKKQYSLSVNKVRKGDKISVVYRCLDESLKLKKALVVYRYSSGDDTAGTRFFITAEISEIDPTTGRITAKMNKPDYPNEWVGYKYWEDRIAKGAKEPEDANYHIGKKLLFGSDEDRTFNLVLDDGVNFSIDGLDAPAEDIKKLKERNVLIFTFPTDCEGHDPLYPEDIYVISDRNKAGRN